MKTGLLIAGLLALSSSVTAAELGYLTHYGSALEATRSASRPLLVVIGRDANFADSDLLPSSSEPLKNYTVCTIDASSAYGERVAKAFRVSSLPHAAIIDKTGKTILFSQSGPISEQAWDATLARFEHGTARREVAARQPVSQPTNQPTSQPSSQAYGGQPGFGGLPNYLGSGLGSFGRSRVFCRT